MPDDFFSAVQERIRKFKLSQIHTPEEWQCFFDDGILLLDHVEDRMKEYAIGRMQKGISSENGQHYQQASFQAAPAAQRLLPILGAIMKQEEKEHCLLRFTMWSSLSDDQKEFFSQWLQDASAHGTLSEEAVATARIQADLYPKEDWNLAKLFLEPFFDHPNDLLRSAAAAAFGEMFVDGADNMPALGEVMQQVKNWEISRPGFAGAFLGQLLMNPNEDGEITESNVKVQDWILEIIAKRVSDEPSVPFYNGIDFQAHEILSSNPEAVRKLMDFGAESVAAMAATEESHPIDGMQKHLEELACSSDNFVSRVCSWHLAYNYRFLHPEGLRRRYVQHEQREDVEIFLVFDPEEREDRPYAATIYSREKIMNDDVAWKWIDMLIPPELRPPMEDNDWPYKTPQIEPGCARFAYGAYIVNLYGDSEKKQWDRVWVKWPLQSSKW